MALMGRDPSGVAPNVPAAKPQFVVLIFFQNVLARLRILTPAVTGLSTGISPTVSNTMSVVLQPS